MPRKSERTHDSEVGHNVYLCHKSGVPTKPKAGVGLTPQSSVDADVGRIRLRIECFGSEAGL